VEKSKEEYFSIIAPLLLNGWAYPSEKDFSTDPIQSLLITLHNQFHHSAPIQTDKLDKIIPFDLFKYALSPLEAQKAQVGKMAGGIAGSRDDDLAL
jgi:hypothetical protein